MDINKLAYADTKERRECSEKLQEAYLHFLEVCEEVLNKGYDVELNFYHKIEPTFYGPTHLLVPEHGLTRKHVEEDSFPTFSINGKKFKQSGAVSSKGKKFKTGWYN